MVIAVTIFPMPVHANVIAHYREIADYRGHNFQPMGTIGQLLRGGRWYVIRPQLLGTIVMLAPLGFLLPFVARRGISLRHAALAALAVSVAIESLQWLISAGFGFVYSSADVDDLVLNTLGGAVGWGCYRLARLVPWLRAVLEPFHTRQVAEAPLATPD